MAESDPKRIRESLTQVLNIVAIVVGVLAEIIPRITGDPLPTPDPSLVIVIMALVNIALRFKTTRPVAFKL